MARFPKFSYANVISSLALFIALGGVSYAAVKLPRNSVGALQIKANAVSGGKVKDGSLTDRDLAPGTILQGLTGSSGTPGVNGSNGAKGDKGDQGIQGLQGNQGIQGIQGIQGPAGTGTNFFGASAADSSQTTNGGHVGITLATELFDSGGNYEPMTSTYTAPSAGIYSFNARVGFNLQNPARAFVRIVSGADTEICRGTDIVHSAGFNGSFVSCIVKLAAGDAITMQLYNTESGEVIRGGNAFETVIAGYRAGG